MMRRAKASRSKRQEYYDVQSIVDKRVTADGTIQYLIRWKGYSKQSDTWQPAKNLALVQELLLQFESNKKMQVKEQNERSSQQVCHKRKKKAHLIESEEKIVNQTKQNLAGKKKKVRNLNEEPIPQKRAALLNCYEVEKIVAKKYNRLTKRNQYKVRWVGYSPRKDTWEPYENLKTVQELVNRFNRELLAKTKMNQLAKISIYQDQFYEVETILDRRVKNGCEQFLIKWKGYNSKLNSWQPLQNLKSISPVFLNHYNFKKNESLSTMVLKPNYETVFSNYDDDQYQVGGIEASFSKSISNNADHHYNENDNICEDDFLQKEQQEIQRLEFQQKQDEKKDIIVIQQEILKDLYLPLDQGLMMENQ